MTEIKKDIDARAKHYLVFFFSTWNGKAAPMKFGAARFALRTIESNFIHLFLQFFNFLFNFFFLFYFSLKFFKLLRILFMLFLILRFDFFRIIYNLLSFVLKFFNLLVYLILQLWTQHVTRTAPRLNFLSMLFVDLEPVYNSSGASCFSRFRT